MLERYKKHVAVKEEHPEQKVPPSCVCYAECGHDCFHSSTVPPLMWNDCRKQTKAFRLRRVNILGGGMGANVPSIIFST